MNWILIVVVLILAGSAVKGFRNGLIKTAFSLVSIILSLIITTVISPVISEALRSNEVLGRVVENQLLQIIPENLEISKKSQETSFIEALPLPESIKNSLIENNNSEVYGALAATRFQEYVMQALTIMVLNVISYFICFLATMILLAFLARILDVISMLPLIHGMNKIAGLFVGVLNGYIKVCVLFFVVTLFSTTNMGAWIFNQIHQSIFLSYIYDRNILLNGIVNLSKYIF